MRSSVKPKLIGTKTVNGHLVKIYSPAEAKGSRGLRVWAAVRTHFQNDRWTIGGERPSQMAKMIKEMEA